MKSIVTTEQAAEFLQISRASYHRLASEGLLLAPFKITPNRSVLYQYEIDAIIQARAAGSDNKSIRQLVQELAQSRKDSRQNFNYATNKNKQIQERSL